MKKIFFLTVIGAWSKDQPHISIAVFTGFAQTVGVGVTFHVCPFGSLPAEIFWQAISLPREQQVIPFNPHVFMSSHVTSAALPVMSGLNAHLPTPGMSLPNYDRIFHTSTKYLLKLYSPLYKAGIWHSPFVTLSSNGELLLSTFK